MEYSSEGKRSRGERFEVSIRVMIIVGLQDTMQAHFFPIPGSKSFGDFRFIPRKTRAMAHRDRSRATWIGKDPEPAPRLGALLILGLGLVISFGLFLRWFWLTDPPPRTHIEVIEITGYGDDYPSLESIWASDFPSVTERGGQKPRNAENVDERLDGIPRPARKELNQDTLFLVVRSLAAADDQGRCTLLIEESEGSSYRMDKFLRKALDRGYRNTIVVADICDLHYYPYLGYIVNPIVAALQSDCESLQDHLRDRKLLLLCAAEDGQRSFRDRDGKTLFREGILKALNDARKDTKNSQNFPIREFCDRVRKYCNRQSQGMQSPVLIPASLQGDSAFDLRISWRDSANNEWYEPPKQASGDSEAKEAEGSEPKTTEPSAADDLQKTADAKPLSPREKLDALRSTKSEQVLPLEIDPLQWRRTLAIGAHDLQNMSIDTLIREVHPPIDKLPRDSRERIILETWNGTGETPLTAEEKKGWLQVRLPLKEYMAFVAEWVAWRDFALEFPSPNSEPRALCLRKEILNATKTLEQRRKELNLCSNQDKNWLASVKPSDNSLHEAKDLLREKLSRHIDSIAKTKTKEWSWLKEQQLLVLLHCPLLESADRKKLENVFVRTRDAVRGTEQGEGDRDWDGRAAIKDRLDLFVDAMRGFGCDELPVLGESTPGNYARWGQRYRDRFRENTQHASDSAPLHRWHQLALRDLPADPVKMERKKELALFYPGNADQKRLAIQPREREGKWIDLDLKTARGKQFTLAWSSALPRESIEIPKLRWRLEASALPPNHAPDASFRIRSDDSRDWKFGTEGSLSSPEASIAIEPTEESIESKLGGPNDRLVLEWLDAQGNVLAKDDLPIVIQAERIDVVLHRAGGGDSIYPSRDGKLADSFTAILNAPVRWDVRLRNKIDKPRIARVIVSDSVDGSEIARSKPVSWTQADTLPVEFEPAAKTASNPSQITPTPVRNFVFRVEELKPKDPSTNGAEGATKEPDILNQWKFYAVLQPDNPKSYVKVNTKRIEESAEQAFDLPFDLPLELREAFWKSVPGVDRVPLVVRWKRANAEKWEKYSTEIRRQSTDRTETAAIPNRPVLQRGENDIVFECDLGGYPRSFAYRLKYNIDASGKDSKIDLESESLRRITTPRLAATVQGTDQPLELKIDAVGRMIFPTKRWENWDNKGDQRQRPTENKIKGLVVQGTEGIDAIQGKIQWQLSKRNEGVLKSESFPDRSIIPDELKLEGSAISFSPKIGEADARIDYDFYGSTATQYQFKICSSHDCEEEFAWSTSLIFDQEPPQPGRMQGSDKLRGGSDYQLSLEWTNDPDQGGSGIAEGYLSIRGSDQLDGQDRDKYDFGADYKLKTKGRLNDAGSVNKKYVMTFDIKAADLEKLKDLPRGRIRFNALVLDKAGNCQTTHDSLSLEWEPAETGPGP